MEKNKVMDDKQKKNPLTNKVKMDFLKPYKKELRDEYKKKQQENKDTHAEIVKKRLERKRAHRKVGKKFISNYRKELEGANQETIKEYKNYIKSTKINIFSFAFSEICLLFYLNHHLNLFFQRKNLFLFHIIKTQ